MLGDSTTNPDPLTMVYNSVRDMLLAHPAFCDNVKPGNVITFTAEHTRDIEPVKENINTADLPEVRIVPVSVIPHLDSDSDNSTLLLRLKIELATGEIRVDRLIFPLIWETFRAMQTWTDHILTLRWNSKRFVTHARPIASILLGTDFPLELIRGVEGWTGVWEYEVLMHVNTVDLANTEL